MQQTILSLPDFSAIDIAQIDGQLDTLLSAARETITQLETSEATWQSFVEPLHAIDVGIEDFFAPISHLNAVANDDALRDVYQRCVAKLTEFSSECGQNAVLFQQYKALEASHAAKSFSSAQTQSVAKSLQDFTLSGIALDAEKQQRFKAIKARLADLSQVFSNNVLDATAAYGLEIKAESALKGLPESLIASFKAKAASKNLEGYLLGLDLPSYQAVVTYAESRALREKLYFAYQCKASDMGRYAMDEALAFDNSASMVEILQLRQELAALLGFERYADYSLARKMANSVDEVADFLLTLADAAHSQGEKDLQQLTDFAKKELGINELQAWDTAFVSEKYRQRFYALNDEALREYFPLDKVIEGLFAITGELFSITFERQEGEFYHPDVRLYQIKRGEELIAAFYFDLFARDKKRGGAWMADCRSRWLQGDNLQLPVAFLTCNFRPASNAAPALLSHDEVTTLFHEFGHGLHHMLTQQTIAPVSGISGVEWDAVELPSQFLENWCWQKEGLAKISAHYKTAEALPESLLNSMLAAKNFNAGLMMLRQVEFSLFDILLHCLVSINNAEQIQDLLDQVREKTALLDPPLEIRFQHGFSHIFAGGYAAGYYSYKWAEVLSADCFAQFEENGLFDAATGRSFLENILEVGSSRPAAESFKAFRGREPQTAALLRHCGLELQS